MQLITHLQNLHYLIGFTGTSGFMLLEAEKNYFFTDFRYKGVAEELKKTKTRVPFEFVEVNKNFEQELKNITAGQIEIAFESRHMSIDELKTWKKKLKIPFKPMKHPIEELRLIKDSGEIKKLKKSQEINEETLKRVLKLLKPGVSELEIAWQVKIIGHELGAEDTSFEPIVAFGTHSSIPHHQNSMSKLKANEVVVIDMGMKFQGYCSDMTRTFLPKKPSGEQTDVYEKVLRAQTLAIEALKAGVKCAKLDEIARKSMGKEAQFFGHSLGHGVGLDVHEAPNLSTASKDTLKEDMVVTVEPGIYLPGKFGVRIEDMGLVGKTSYQNFAKFGK